VLIFQLIGAKSCYGDGNGLHILSIGPLCGGHHDIAKCRVFVILALVLLALVLRDRAGAG